MTPVSQNGGVNLTCRSCKEDEEWYSIKELNERANPINNSLTPEQKTLIGDNGITLGLEGDVSLKTLMKDHPDFVEGMSDKTGMCLSDASSLSSYKPYKGGSSCNSYEGCMETATSYIDLSWPNGPSYSVYPGQIVELRNLETPLVVSIPDNIKDKQCMDNPIYNNQFHNKICDGTDNKCHLRIPVDPLPVYRNPPALPSYRIIKHGGNSTESGPPCDSVNELAQDYNLANGRSIADYSNINTTDKYVNTSTADDWRNIIGLLYDECYDHSGKCHIPEFICSTSNDTPIPLVDYSAPSPILTIPEASKTGCQNATLVGNCNTQDATCEAMTTDTHGNLIVDPTGKCKSVKWNGSNWSEGSGNDYHFRCFPSYQSTAPVKLMGQYVIHVDDIIPGNPDIKFNKTIIKDGLLEENLCKRIPRLTDSDGWEASITNGRPCTSATSGTTGAVVPDSRQCNNPPPNKSCILLRSNPSGITYHGDDTFESMCCIIPGSIVNPGSKVNQTVNAYQEKSWGDVPPGATPTVIFTDGSSDFASYSVIKNII